MVEDMCYSYEIEQNHTEHDAEKRCVIFVEIFNSTIQVNLTIEIKCF